MTLAIIIIQVLHRETEKRERDLLSNVSGEVELTTKWKGCVCYDRDRRGFHADITGRLMNSSLNIRRTNSKAK